MVEMENISLWKALTPTQKSYETFSKDHETEVTIVGGGITGMTCAWILAQVGKKVIVLEKDAIGGGTTGFSTGNLYIPVQPLYQKIRNKFNKETAFNVMQARKEAIDFIENIVSSNDLNCNFQRRPWYFFTDDPKKIKIIDKEGELLSQKFNIEEVKTLDVPFSFKKAIGFQNQARFNPLEFTVKLAGKLADTNCVKIFENSQVISFEENEKHCVVNTENGKIRTEHLFFSTHVPIGINIKQLSIAPYRSYVVAAKSNNIPNGNFWNAESPHHALSTHSSSQDLKLDIIALAGEHHKTGQFKNSMSNYRNLENILKKYYQIQEFSYRWSAQHYQTVDKLPYIGLASRSNKKTYIATGFFADGLVYGVLAAIIISDKILGKENRWENTFDATRFMPLSSIQVFVKENTNVFSEYLSDMPGNTGANNKQEIPKNEGRIIQVKQQKIAVYHDNEGQYHCVSAVCTHMKCIVKWNNAEKTWDCPCHGSRFDTKGNVIEGPAIAPLEKMDIS